MKKWLPFLLLAAAVVLGLLVPLMDNDGANNAAISLRMTSSANHTSIVGTSDIQSPQPHLQFWFWAISFKLFGVSGIVYKLHSLLFVILALFSTYKLGEYLVPRKGVGAIAALILMSMTAFMYSSSVDVGHNAILTGSVIFAIWQGVVCIGGGGVGRGESYGSRRTLDRFHFMPYFGLAFGLGLALSSGGAYSVVTVVAPMLCYMIAARRTKWLISWRPLIVIAMFAILILPELLAQYTEFGWSAVRTILFEQTTVYNGNQTTVSALYLIGSILLSTMPWALLILFFVFRSLWYRRIDSIYSLIIISSALVVVLLSLSSFELPRLTAIFPLLSIYLADEFRKIEIRTPLIKGIAITQKIIVCLIIIAAISINYFFFPFPKLWMSIVYGAALLSLVYTLFGNWLRTDKILAYSIAASAILWIGLNGNLYPQLLNLQAGNKIAAICKTKGIKASDVVVLDNSYRPSFDISHGALHREVSANQLKDSLFVLPARYLFIDTDNFNRLSNHSVVIGRGLRIIERIPDVNVSNFSISLFDSKSRNMLTDTIYLIDSKR